MTEEASDRDGGPYSMTIMVKSRLYTYMHGVRTYAHTRMYGRTDIHACMYGHIHVCTGVYTCVRAYTHTRMAYGRAMENSVLIEDHFSFPQSMPEKSILTTSTPFKLSNLIIKDNEFAWKGSLESLKLFVQSDLNIEGQWLISWWRCEAIC